MAPESNQQSMTSAPEAFTGQCPVDVILEPVAEAAVLDVFGHPVDRLVEFGHAIGKIRGTYIPCVLGVIEDWIARAPAKRIVVAVALRAEHQTALLENADQWLVGIFEKQALDGFDRVDEVAVQADTVHDGQAVCLAQREVIDAIGRCRMHNTGAVLRADEISRHDRERIVRIDIEIVEEALVTHANQLVAAHGPDDFVFHVAKYGLAQGFGHDQRLSVGLAKAVVDVFAYGQSEVGRQRPGRGGPHEEIGIRFPRDLETHGNRRILGFLVPLRQLVRRQGCADARIVGNDLVSLVDQVLVPDRLEQIPDRLDVGVVERVIGFVEIDPEA
ncbi:MAG: hypothetical protein P8Y01_13980, partial [Woeseiaceae bacterium]